MANRTDHITPVSGLQYYICMLDFGRRARVSGFGADVCPEYTREQIVEEVRDWIAVGRTIVHVKFVNGNDMQDVTDEILRDAMDENYNPGLVTLQDLIDERNDHARKLRAEAV